MTAEHNDARRRSRTSWAVLTALGIVGAVILAHLPLYLNYRAERAALDELSRRGAWFPKTFGSSPWVYHVFGHRYARLYAWPRAVYIRGDHITDAGLVHLHPLPMLGRLDLARTCVTDAGIVALGRLPHLRALVLEDTEVTPAGIAALRKAIPNLWVNEQPP